MSILRRLVAALLLVPIVALAAQAQEYRVQPGDVLQIEVLEDATLNRSAIVLPDGQITLPVAGTFRVAGRSIAQVQDDLARRLAQGFAAAPTVFVSLSALAPRQEPTPPRTIAILPGAHATAHHCDLHSWCRQHPRQGRGRARLHASAGDCAGWRIDALRRQETHPAASGRQSRQRTDLQTRP